MGNPPAEEWITVLCVFQLKQYNNLARKSVQVVLPLAKINNKYKQHGQVSGSVGVIKKTIVKNRTDYAMGVILSLINFVFCRACRSWAYKTMFKTLIQYIVRYCALIS